MFQKFGSDQLDQFYNTNKEQVKIIDEDLPQINSIWQGKDEKKVQKKVIKKDKIKRQDSWTPQHRITAIKDIREVRLFTKDGKVKEPGKCTKRFKISFNYVVVSNGKPGTEKTATVRFGERDQKYYPEHLDVDKKQVQASKLKKASNPFNPSFWVVWLLLNQDTISKSRAHFCDVHNFKFG